MRCRCRALAVSGTATCAWLATCAAAAIPHLGGQSLIAQIKELGGSDARMIACTGPRGSGKTSLMRTMFGPELEGSEAVLPDDGLVLVDADTNSDDKAAASSYTAAVSSADVILYNTFQHDLLRSNSALAHDLQPVLDEVLQSRSEGVLDDSDVKSLFIVVRDSDGDEAVQTALSSELASQLQRMWSQAQKAAAADGAVPFDSLFKLAFAFMPNSSLSQKTFSSYAEKLRQDVVRSGLRSSAGELVARLQTANKHLHAAGHIPAAKEMNAVYVAKSAAAQCLSSFRTSANSILRGSRGLDPEFGARVDSISRDVLQQYDQAVSEVSGSSIVAKKRKELQRATEHEIYNTYIEQLKTLRRGAEQQYQEKSATLRFPGSLSRDLESAVKEALKHYDDRAKALKSSHLPAQHTAERKALAAELRAAAKEKVQQAKLQGLDVSARKKRNIGIGLHWLLPKPFGTEARQNPINARDAVRIDKSKAVSESLFFDFTPLDEIDAPEGDEVSLPKWDKKLAQYNGMVYVSADDELGE